MSYYDARDEELYRKRYSRFDERKMLVTVSVTDPETEDEFDVELPVKFEVCELCCGKGKHVDPGIDSDGLTYEDFEDDPDFEESYFSGQYDVTCYRCRGAQVEPQLDIEAINHSKELKEHYKLYCDGAEDRAAYASERAAERRMGY